MHVGIDSPERDAELLRGEFAPVARFAHGIFVADHDRALDLVAELQKRMLRIAAQNEPDASLAGTLGNVGNTLREKCVMTQVGVRIKRYRREEDDDRLMQEIGDFDCEIERGVVECALGALHPVHDAATVAVRSALTTDGDTRISGKRFDLGHDGLRACTCFGGQNFIRDSGGINGGLHIVHTDNVRSMQDARDHGCQRSVESLIGWSVFCASAFANGAADERLARGSGEQGKAQALQAVQLCEQRVVLLVSLAETETRIEHNAPTLDAAMQGNLHAISEIVRYEGRDICARRQVAPLAWPTASVHHDDSASQFGARTGHGFVPLESADVVDDFSTDLDCAPGHDGFIGVDGKNGVRPRLPHSFDYGSDAPQFLLFGDERFMAGSVGLYARARTRRFASNVEDIGTVVEHLKGVRNGRPGLEKSSTIGERIGGDVDDSHDERAGTEVERTRTKLPAVESAHAAIVICGEWER